MDQEKKPKYLQFKNSLEEKKFEHLPQIYEASEHLGLDLDAEPLELVRRFYLVIKFWNNTILQEPTTAALILCRWTSDTPPDFDDIKEMAQLHQHGEPIPVRLLHKELPSY